MFRNSFQYLLDLFQKNLSRLYETATDKKIHTNIVQIAFFSFSSFVSGLISVVYADLFHAVEKYSNYIYHYNKYFFLIISPCAFLTAVMIVRKYMPFARGSGIPQVMAALHLSNKRNYPRVSDFLGFRIILVKMLSNLLMVFGGAVTGREGPTIQISASIFKKFDDWLPKSMAQTSKKSTIIAGAASGLAAAFNTPLGGIVFAVEELARTHLTTFKSPLFAAVIIAGLTAQGIYGPYLYLGYPNLEGASSMIIFGVLLAAAIIGWLGGMVARSLFAMVKYMRSLKPNLRVGAIVIASLLIALAIIFLGISSVGSGKDEIVRLLFSSNKQVEWYAPLVRIIGLGLSFSLGGSGGIFAPSLSIGAVLGGGLANLWELNQGSSNLLTLVGMVAFLTGITRSPFTCAILVLEMTDRHGQIFNLMLAGLVANTVALTVDNKSLYQRLEDQYIDETKVSKKTDTPIPEADPKS